MKDGEKQRWTIPGPDSAPMLKRLLDLKADVHAADWQGATPLHWVGCAGAARLGFV